MKNIKNLTVLLITFLMITACNTIRQGFTPDKKSGEEFLVEKKSPLVMPPSYNDLPIPKQEQNNLQNKKTNIQSLISGSEGKTVLETKTEGVSSIEKLILQKIKKN